MGRLEPFTTSSRAPAIIDTVTVDARGLPTVTVNVAVNLGGGTDSLLAKWRSIPEPGRTGRQVSIFTFSGNHVDLRLCRSTIGYRRQVEFLKSQGREWKDDNPCPSRDLRPSCGSITNP